MKTSRILIAATLSLALSSIDALAQGDQPRPPREGGGGPEGRRPVPPLVAALDTNRDGVIDADEMAKAAESLKKLDKNNDGKLTMEELRPQGGPRDGEGGPRGPRDGEGGPRRGPRDGEGGQKPGPRDGDRPQKPPQ